MDISGKKFLITGASEGIGEQIAYALAKEKAALILLARSEDKLEKIKEIALNKGAISVEIIICDLKQKDQIKKISSQLSSKHTELNGLINNAGIWQKLNTLDNISDEEIISVVQTNLTGLILLTKYLLPLLKNSDEGVLINISSRSGYSAQAGQSIYTATKYGVRGFTEVMREDLKQSNIKVAGIYQGGTHTNMFKKAGEDWTENTYKSFIPASELADVITFLISRPNGIWLPEIRIESH